jgi:sulfatase maturation enzyme AslB (radical SAM superfamily)
LEKLKFPIDITFKEIDDYLDDIEWREDGLNSTIVLFGGEPLLMLDKIEYTLNSIIHRNKKGGWGWDITTNGFLLLNDKIFKRVNNLLKLNNENICGNVKISFDVSG